MRQRAAPLKGARCAVTQQFDVARTELICPVVALRTLWHSSVDIFMGSKKRKEVLHSGVPEKRAWQTNNDIYDIYFHFFRSLLFGEMHRGSGASQVAPDMF